MKKDEFVSQSFRSLDATTADVKIHIRTGKKVLASSAQTSSEAEGKPQAKVMASATTLHVPPKS
jgi:hypothetical protein